MAQYLRFKNWSTYQAYHDRRLTWIKLYTSILWDATFNTLCTDDQMALIRLWLANAEACDKLEYDPIMLARRCNTVEPINFDRLIELGFIWIEGEGANTVPPSTDKPRPVAVDNPVEKTEQKPKRKYVKRAEPQPDPMIGFDEFYEAYPRHIGKGQAEKTWKKLAADDALRQIIIAGAKRFAEHCRANHKETEYIKHPSTWLNAKGWEDELGSGSLTADDDLPDPDAPDLLEFFEDDDRPDEAA